ncbi:MAG TPA: UbiD family decarboxylase [Chloroflexota bacterium]|nr:UbiD family decarboxylase [Chloroflexota bacterium]
MSAHGAGAPGSLREQLARLEARGLLHRVRAEVDPTWELASIVRQVFRQHRPERRYALLFERVRGHALPVVVGALAASRAVYATGLGVAPEAILERWATALRCPLEPRLSTGRLPDELVLQGEAVDLTALPIPVWTPTRDAAPYIAGPCCITRDPETGVHNVAMRRMMLKDRRRLAFNVQSHPRTEVNAQHTAWEYAKYEARNEPMPVAVVFGAEPVVGYVSAAKVPYAPAGRWSDYALAGGLAGRPLELIPCLTVPLYVPASAEVVLEGVVAPHVREPEGPFGEFFGYMSRPGPRPVLEVRCIRLRREPLIQYVHSQRPPSESMVAQGIGNAGLLYKRLVYDLGFSEVVDVHIPEHTPLTHIIIQARRVSRAYAAQILHAAWTALASYSGKVLTLVDEDIDIRDPQQVEWAVHTRVQPHRDLTIVRPTRPLSLDPSVAPQWSETAEASKLLVDATCKWEYPPPALPPAELLARVRERWEGYGLPPLD